MTDNLEIIGGLVTLTSARQSAFSNRLAEPRPATGQLFLCYLAQNKYRMTVVHEIIMMLLMNAIFLWRLFAPHI